MKNNIDYSVKNISFEIDEIINLYASYVDINVELGHYLVNTMKQLELVVNFDFSNLLVIEGDIIEEIEYNDGHASDKLYRISDIDETIYKYVINNKTTFIKNLNDTDNTIGIPLPEINVSSQNYSCAVIPVIYNDVVVAVFSIFSCTDNISESMEEIMVYVDFLKLRVINSLKYHSTRINEEIVYALDYVTDGYFIRRGNFINLSKKAQEIFNFDEGIIESEEMLDAFTSESAENITSAINKRLETLTLIMHTKDGLILEIDSFLVDMKDNKSMVISVINDITNNQMKLNQFENLAYIDSLTKLKNYNSLMASLDKIDEDEDLSIINFDIDKFKFINDTYGHSVGDIALVFFAKCLMNTYGDFTDQVFRKSGDEFIVILNEEVSKSQIVESFNILSTLLTNQESYPSNLPVKLEYSAGVASFIETNHSKDNLFLFADLAMYDAKRNNDNCCYEFFDNTMFQKYMDEKDRVNQIIDAIDNNKIEVGYREIKSIDGTIHGYKTAKKINDVVLSVEEIANMTSKNDILFKFERKVLKDVLFEQSELIKNGKEQVEIHIPIKADFFVTNNFYNDVLQLTEKYNLSPSLINFIVVNLNSSTKIENTVSRLNQYIQKGYALSFDFKFTVYPNTHYLKMLDFAHYSAPRILLDVLETSDTSRDAVYLSTLFYALAELKVDAIFEDVLVSDIDLLRKFGIKNYILAGDDKIKSLNDLINN